VELVLVMYMVQERVQVQELEVELVLVMYMVQERVLDVEQVLV
jgi:hypothetical protein